MSDAADIRAKLAELEELSSRWKDMGSDRAFDIVLSRGRKAYDFPTLRVHFHGWGPEPLATFYGSATEAADDARLWLLGRLVDATPSPCVASVEALDAEYTRRIADVHRLEYHAMLGKERLGAWRHEAIKTLPVFDRLVYAATLRCKCGAGYAYDPANEGQRSWACSALILGTVKELDTLDHGEPMPFAFYEVKSERQASSHGATTRPASDPTRIPF